MVRRNFVKADGRTAPRSISPSKPSAKRIAARIGDDRVVGRRDAASIRSARSDERAVAEQLGAARSSPSLARSLRRCARKCGFRSRTRARPTRSCSRPTRKFNRRTKSLTTSKEEMQSMNEELQTINHELQAKVDDAVRLNNDMKNLLENTEVTSVFLDRDLRVRLFTAGSSRILKLIPGDVGRPMTDITSDLVYPGFTDDARAVMRTLAASTRVAEHTRGRRFRCA